MPRWTVRLLVGQAELPFQHAVDTAHLLFFAQLTAVLGQTGIFLLTMLAGRIGSALNPHLSVKHFSPFRNSFSPSRRH